MFTTAIPSSRHSQASGYWVMLMTSQPASLNHFDSTLRREPRTLDDDHGAAVVDLDAVVADRLDRQPAQRRVVGLRRREVGHDRPVEEGVGAPARPVHELVAHDEVAGLDGELQRAGGAWRDRGLDPERLHRPHVRPVVDPVRRDRVAPAVTRQERDTAAGDLGQEDRIGGRAVRRVHLDLAHVVEKGVEPRASEDADLRGVRHVHSSVHPCKALCPQF